VPEPWAYADLSGTLLARADTETQTTIVFRMRGRHVGPLTTPLGVLPPTGQMVERQVIDLLVLREGRIAEIWAHGPGRRPAHGLRPKACSPIRAEGASPATGGPPSRPPRTPQA
jgi:hypothetical protein